jgi:hypothetical protein
MEQRHLKADLGGGLSVSMKKVETKKNPKPSPEPTEESDPVEEGGILGRGQAQEGGLSVKAEL